MIENEFFPTPPSLAKTMIGKYARRASSILDPNAGNGALLDVAAELSPYTKGSMYAIEIDQDLRFVLQQKGYRVIGSDFFKYGEPFEFDLVIMNPPFSKGAAHVLHAWDFVASEGVLISLLNAETIKNPYSIERQKLEALIRDHRIDSVEYLGSAFKESERPTDVEVALIRLRKPKKQSIIDSFSFDQFKTEGDISAEEFAANPLAHPNKVKNLVAQYNLCVELLRERKLIHDKLDFYLSNIKYPVGGTDQNSLRLWDKAKFQAEVELLKSRFWNTVFTEAGVAKRTTSGFRQKFYDYAVSQSSMAFSEENIIETLSLFFCNQNEIMMESLTDIFDKVTGLCKDNKIHSEGWATNKSYRLNHKIITPWCIEYGSQFKNWDRRYGSYSMAIIDDLDRVLCWLCGKNYDSPDFVSVDESLKQFINKCNAGWDYTVGFQTTFFKAKIFKKGTMHLTFRDRKLLNEFNVAAAKGKKWIGDGG